jgi:3-methyladenine DNA glycosylase AlkC
MPAATEPHPAQLKDWFDENRHHRLAQDLKALSKDFRHQEFLNLTLDGLEARSLMQRLHQCALAADATLPGSYRQKARLLQKLAPKIGHSFVAIFTCDFIATFGLEDFDFSMEALRTLTRFGSAEFAVRPFIAADPARALAIMHLWSHDPCEHVRRLASEGSRPRLPWGMKLKPLIQDPSLSAPILDSLREDPSAYVRRSVANHLNDITKDHPEWVLEKLEAWGSKHEATRWIARHACRTLIKQGHARALRLFGFSQQAEIQAHLKITPKKLHLGDRLHLEVTLQSTRDEPQSVAVDYIIHYVKQSGAAFQKVFKWKEAILPGLSRITLQKSQVIRDFTTRKHYPGHHIVELQVNGDRVAKAGFDLRL